MKGTVMIQISGKKQKLIPVLCAILLIIGIVLSGFSINADGITPNWNCGAYTPENNLFAKINLYGQCTWYAWGRAYEKTGVKLPCTGHAKTWYETASDAGIAVGQQPKENAIAVWGGDGYGHVAFVENFSNGVVTLTHANSGSNITTDYIYTLEEGIQYFAGSFTKTENEMKNLNGKPLIGYIYLTNNNVEVIGYTLKNSIDLYDAQLWGRVFKPKNSAVTKIGIRLWQKEFEENAIFKTETPSKDYIGSSFMEPYYDVEKELGTRLKTGTEYYYQIYAVVDGIDYFSSPVLFKTGGFPHKNKYRLSDIIQYAKYIVGELNLTVQELHEADYNYDGAVNLSDVVSWAKFIAES